MPSSAHNPVILTYHSISSGPTPIEISPEILAQQMEWLAANARVVPLDEIVDALKKRKPLPPRTVALTFDDGFANFYSDAAPILLRHKFPAIVFVATKHVGKTNGWPGQPEWVTPAQLMTWDQIRELSGKGIAFGSHSVTHPDLTSLSPNNLSAELMGSWMLTESKTDLAPCTINFFCYPYGRWNRTVRDEVKKYYAGACSTAAGVVEPNADPYALPRVDAHYVRNMKWFRRMFTTAFTAYIGARRTIRRLRGQPEGRYARI